MPSKSAKRKKPNPILTKVLKSKPSSTKRWGKAFAKATIPPKPKPKKEAEAKSKLKK